MLTNTYFERITLALDLESWPQYQVASGSTVSTGLLTRPRFRSPCNSEQSVLPYSCCKAAHRISHLG